MGSTRPCRSRRSPSGSRCCGRGAGPGRTAPVDPGAVLALERPFEDRPGVGRRADRAAVAAHERLQVRRRVHVGDRHDPLDVGDLGERLPGLLDRVDVGHVGHRAAGVQVGQHHLLVVAGEDVGRLGHEVHAAEDDVVGLRALLGEHRQPERVAPGVGPAHDLVALVVVAEDEEPLAERRPSPRRSDQRAPPARRRCTARGAGLEPQHVVGTSCRESALDLRPLRFSRWGQPGRHATGMSASEVDGAGYQAGRVSVHSERSPGQHPSSTADSRAGHPLPSGHSASWRAGRRIGHDLGATRGRRAMGTAHDGRTGRRRVRTSAVARRGADGSGSARRRGVRADADR